MAVGGILATALNTGAARAYGLYLDGTDVVKQPGGLVGVPIGTVSIDEAGPGGTSALSFAIDDPAISVVVTDGMAVRFADLAHDVPLFLGYVQAWTYAPDFGGQGRVISVTCVGIEALLDWCVLANDVTFPAGTRPSDAIASLAAQAVGTGPLRWASDTSGPTTSSVAYPTGYYTGWTTQSNHTITAGTTLREAIRIVFSDTPSGGGAGNPVVYVATVDFYAGLRTFLMFSNGLQPTDWGLLNVVDTPPGTYVAEGLQHTIDAAAITRGVQVQGGNAAGSGTVSDGTGKIGPIATLSDSTILDTPTRNAVAATYLSTFAVSIRGTFTLSDFTPPLTVHAGSPLFITDATVGVTAADLTGRTAIGGIAKTFAGSLQTWRVSYGGLAPSAMRSVRRLTRTTLS